MPTESELPGAAYETACMRCGRSTGMPPFCEECARQHPTTPTPITGECTCSTLSDAVIVGYDPACPMHFPAREPAARLAGRRDRPGRAVGGRRVAGFGESSDFAHSRTIDRTHVDFVGGPIEYLVGPVHSLSCRRGVRRRKRSRGEMANTITIETVRKLVSQDAAFWGADCDDYGWSDGDSVGVAWSAIQDGETDYAPGTLRVRHPEHTAGEWVTVG